MNVVSIDARQPRGVTFPVKHVKKSGDSIFPVQEYDWDDIGKRLEPLVGKVIDNIKNNRRRYIE